MFSNSDFIFCNLTEIQKKGDPDEPEASPLPYISSTNSSQVIEFVMTIREDAIAAWKGTRLIALRAVPSRRDVYCKSIMTHAISSPVLHLRYNFSPSRCYFVDKKKRSTRN